MKALRHLAFRFREQFERVHFFFELIGAIVVGAFIAAMVLDKVHRVLPL